MDLEFSKLSIIFKDKVCHTHQSDPALLPAYVNAKITGIPLYLAKISSFRHKYKRGGGIIPYLVIPPLGKQPGEFKIGS